MRALKNRWVQLLVALLVAYGAGSVYPVGKALIGIIHACTVYTTVCG